MESMEEKRKPKVYVETSVISNLTARPSHNPVDAAMQIATASWWYYAPHKFNLFGSQLVLDEAARGDVIAAGRRLQIAAELKALPIDERIVALAEKLLEATAVPHSNYDDAVHIATAAVHGMDYLVTWNCRHIANVYTKPLIYRCCLANGFKSAEICTPPEMEGDDENV